MSRREGADTLAALADQLLGQGCDLARLETVLLERALESAGGNVTRAAKLLGLSRATLDYRLKKSRQGL
jgi:two-component system response regulator HydG